MERYVLRGGRASYTRCKCSRVRARPALARETAAEHGIANVEFRVANVNDWDERDAYDFVYCRFLLKHLSRPAALPARMWSAVRPGGAIAVEDTDFDGSFCDPPNGGFDFHKRMYPRVLEHNGGDARIGRKLYRYFLEAGIPDPGLHLVQSVDAAGEAKSERDRRSVLEQSLQPDPLEERRSGQSGYLTLPGEHGRMILRGFRGRAGRWSRVFPR